MKEKLSSDIQGLRKDYALNTLTESSVKKSPIEQLKVWLDEAIREKVPEANAMQLSTIGEDMFPEARIVLLRGIDELGLRFFTNYDSDKGQQIARCNKIAVNFFWPELERQVRIRGLASKVSVAESDAYFASRPRESQIGAWASKQSTKIPNRSVLEAEWNKLINEFEGKSVPRPPHWGGYLIKPIYFEFWQGGKNRLHDRLVYELENNNWHLYRLSP